MPVSQKRSSVGQLRDDMFPGVHASIIGRWKVGYGVNVAFGRFVPLPAYVNVQKAVVESAGGSQDHLFLSVRLTNGSPLPGGGTIHLEDHSFELGPEGLELSVLGIAYPIYEELFPAHVAAYARQFPKSNST